jgi:hypothetical protein
MGQAMVKYKPLPKKVEYSSEKNEFLIFYKSFNLFFFIELC